MLTSQINQLIATNLDKDQDVGNYRMICKNTLDSIDADGCSFWRRRFLTIFESPSWVFTGQRLRDNEKFRDQYQKRKATLSNTLPWTKHEGLGFLVNYGTFRKEKRCLEILRDMIIGELHQQAQKRTLSIQPLAIVKKLADLHFLHRVLL